jgi:hypothetical protein
LILRVERRDDSWQEQPFHPSITVRSRHAAPREINPAMSSDPFLASRGQARVVSISAVFTALIRIHGLAWRHL